MMKILKEATNTNPNLAKAVYNLIADKSAKDLENLLLGKANGSSKAIKVLTDIAKAITNKDPNYPTKRLGFLTRNMPKFNNSSSTEYIDFKKLVKDPEFNLLGILGLLSIPLYYDALKPNPGQNISPYQKFLSMFSENGNFNDLSYILLGEFTEAFNVDNINNNNEFINRYLKTDLFTNRTRNKKSFERVYNSYVNDNVFDKNSIRKLLK